MTGTSGSGLRIQRWLAVVGAEEEENRQQVSQQLDTAPIAVMEVWGREWRDGRGEGGGGGGGGTTAVQGEVKRPLLTTWRLLLVSGAFAPAYT